MNEKPDPKEEQEPRKPYAPPDVVYEQPLEVLAGTCAKSVGQSLDCDLSPQDS